MIYYPWFHPHFWTPMEPMFILPEVKYPKVWREGCRFVDKDTMIKPMRATFMRYAIRNTDQVKEGELKSYWDLLDPKWKGKIVMGDPSRPGAGSALHALLNNTWGHDKAIEFLKQLVRQDPVITREARLPMEWLARGKYALGVALRADVIPEFEKMGAPVAVVKMTEGGALTPGSGNVAVVNRRPHPNAAAVFINWILTKEGQTVWSKADCHASSRLDVSTEWVSPVFLAGPGEKVWVENEQAIKGKPALMKEARKIIAPLMK